MKRILQKLKKRGLKVVQTKFTEDGYEIWIKPINSDEPERFLTAKLRQDLPKIENMDYSGYVPSEYLLDKGVCKVLLVPKDMNPITEFIWTYIELWGNDENNVEDMLMDACCALQKSIERIPETFAKEKEEAERNYISFSKMIF